jgi:hypothetical protein
MYADVCRHYNALPDARILLHVTDKQIEDGFFYLKTQYPEMKFRVYRCDRCNGMMEEAIPLQGWSSLFKEDTEDLFRY